MFVRSGLEKSASVERDRHFNSRRVTTVSQAPLALALKCLCDRCIRIRLMRNQWPCLCVVEEMCSL